MIRAWFNDIWEVIYVEFSNEIVIHWPMMAKPNDCSEILSLGTVIKLGLGVKCHLKNGDSTTLQINLGFEPTILAEELLEFIPDVISKDGC